MYWLIPPLSFDALAFCEITFTRTQLFEFGKTSFHVVDNIIGVVDGTSLVSATSLSTSFSA